MTLIKFINCFNDPESHETSSCENCLKGTDHPQYSLWRHFDLPKTGVKKMPYPYKSYKSKNSYQEREEKIEQRIAVKDKIFVVLNASKAAAELVQAEAQSGKKIFDALFRYRELRDAINKENWDIIFSGEKEPTLPSPDDIPVIES